jgi:hypothetical protein
VEKFGLLRRPGLPIERIDTILRTLLESRMHSDSDPHMPALLVQSLRTDSVDVRTRINDVLVWLAELLFFPDGKVR